MSSTSLLKALHGLAHCKVVFCTLLQKGTQQKEHSCAGVGYFACIFNTLPNFFFFLLAHLLLTEAMLLYLISSGLTGCAAFLTVAPVLSVMECMHAYIRCERGYLQLCV